mmetsp:Transcript_88395/g.279714  ORF Transcript_88395/g.279714 Transcript_88395/m.279714 type:complete len:271 (+) Transcript_88395:352-1164(+)
MSPGKSKMITWLTSAMSTPRPSTSVVKSAFTRPSRKARSAASRCSCVRLPCITPQRSRPKRRATVAPSSSASSRRLTKTKAFPGVSPSSPPSAPSRWVSSRGSFRSMAASRLQWDQRVLITSTFWWISRGGSAMPARPGSVRLAAGAGAAAAASAAPPSASSAGAAETRSKGCPREQRRWAAASTSGGQVAEKKRTWRSGRTFRAMAATSGSKPSSSMRSPSSRTKNETRCRPTAPSSRKSRSLPGVATNRCVCRCRRSACSWSARRTPP